MLAMAQYQLGEKEEARTVLTKGVQIEQAKLEKLESGDLGSSWVDWLTSETLVGEAKALIEGTPVGIVGSPNKK